MNAGTAWLLKDLADDIEFWELGIERPVRSRQSADFTETMGTPQWAEEETDTRIERQVLLARVLHSRPKPKMTAA